MLQLRCLLPCLEGWVLAVTFRTLICPRKRVEGTSLVGGLNFPRWTLKTPADRVWFLVVWPCAVVRLDYYCVLGHLLDLLVAIVAIVPLECHCLSLLMIVTAILHETRRRGYAFIEQLVSCTSILIHTVHCNILNDSVTLCVLPFIPL